MKRITIIGGGASGTLLAINLAAQAKDKSIQINLVEKSRRLARGVAYSADKDFYLLNVPANKMGAFPDQPQHFYRWLTDNTHDYYANEFVPRRLYGDYLWDLLRGSIQNMAPNAFLDLYNGEVVDVLFNEKEMTVLLDSGKEIQSDHVVLAFGNFPPPHPKTSHQYFISSQKYFHNPWKAEEIGRINPADDVLIIGTGLSMVDAALNLYHQNHRGEIFALSTRGLLPAVHELGYVYPNIFDELKHKRLSDILKIVRKHCDEAGLRGSDWRAVIDSLRPDTQELWINLSDTDKRRFMQHLSRYWNAARHRMPPQAAGILREMQKSGHLKILKGRLLEVNVDENLKFEISYTSAGKEENLSVDAFINCIGSESNFSKIESPLIKNLLEKGYLRSNHLNLGLDALPDGRILNENGSVSNRIFIIGTALKGILMESIAMPEICSQAHRLASDLVDIL